MLMLLLAAAWSPSQDEGDAPTSAVQDPSPSADAETEKTIRARFAASAIASNRFEVRVVDGVAILRGRTDVVQHKGTATRLARLAGADRVDNRIEVTDRARASASRSSRSQPRRVRVQRPDSDRDEDR